MSCNGCRVLRKGCSESCILRPCLQWIETAEAQGHATVFVAKFFGRAGLMSFIAAVPESQRPALFQSLLYEACGRTVNPVNGAVGLLWTGNWHLCQAAVETVLRGGALRPIPELLNGNSLQDEVSEAEVTCSDLWRKLPDPNPSPRSNHYKTPKPRRSDETSKPDLDLSLSASLPANPLPLAMLWPVKLRQGSPSMTSEESGTTTCLESSVKGNRDYGEGMMRGEPKLLNLFC